MFFVEIVVVQRLPARDLGVFLPEGAHDAHAGQVLLRERCEIAELRLHVLEAPVDASARATMPSTGSKQHRQRGDGGQRRRDARS